VARKLSLPEITKNKPEGDGYPVSLYFILKGLSYMPVVKFKATPPPPEGEYAGIMEKVASNFTKIGEQRFSYNIRTKDGKVIRDNLYFSENVSWRIPQLCKSANLVPPENGAPFILTTDDLEGRWVTFAVKHNTGSNGQVYVNVNFHTLSYAIQQDPTLAGAFPSQTPRKLREAPSEEPPETSGAPASTPPPPPTAAPSAAAPEVGIAEAEDEKLSPEEYAEVLAKYRKEKAAKAGKPQA
jgi:hypothetical protein